MQKFLQALAGSQKYFVNYVSVAIFIVMAWIGGLKVVQYEADGIVPFVTNSPFFSYMYSKKDIVDNGKGKMVAEYNLHKNPEGLVVPKNIEWHKQNGTYAVSYLIGAMICTIGTLVLLGIWFPKLGLIGGLLTFGMSIVTLSFLITTPETWVPNLGNPALGITESPNHGFPYLSGAGRLVLKDIIMSAAGLIVASNAARRILECCKSCSAK
ncbi:hypothetical membrane protein (DUF417 domain) [Campylobacter showae]|jgi:uncharacterized 23.0 kDa protein in purT/mpa1 5'region|uniref:Inner membrane protein YkgB n=1 Tax=Campylobacter showae RM3277 TaxID=553219 RepID=C6RD70_9BACT|nr:DUF417 family protein [Campylobacter showae]EET80637.1 hypothetical protein CAMSH0001_1786 [Campylobacter showae RM3277]QCD49181.1 hypothetical membrane protein (DUF417 domain) [Campylobacter showae]